MPIVFPAPRRRRDLYERVMDDANRQARPEAERFNEMQHLEFPPSAGNIMKRMALLAESPVNRRAVVELARRHPGAVLLYRYLGSPFWTPARLQRYMAYLRDLHEGVHFFIEPSKWLGCAVLPRELDDICQAYHALTDGSFRYPNLVDRV